MKGEVYWLELPDEKRRPALIMTRSEAIPVLRNLVVAVATRRARGIPSELAVGPTDGMPEESVISFDNLRTVPKVLLTSRICSLEGRMTEACRVMAAALDC